MKKTVTAEYRCDYCDRAFTDLSRCTHHESMCRDNPYQFARSKDIMNTIFKLVETDGFTERTLYISPLRKKGDRIYECNVISIDINSKGEVRNISSARDFSVGDFGECTPIPTKDFLKEYSAFNPLLVQVEADAKYQSPDPRCNECLTLLGKVFIVRDNRPYCKSCAERLRYLDD